MVPSNPGSGFRRPPLLVVGAVLAGGVGILALLLGQGGPPVAAGCLAALVGLVARLAARHRETERRLESAFLFQRQLVDQIPIPVFYKDINRVYIGCNQAYERLMGVDRSQVIGKTVFDVAPPELARTYDEQDRQLLEERGVQVYRSVLARGDLRREVVFHKATFDLPGGLPGGIIGAIQDLTEQGEAQARAEALAHELQVLFHTVPMGLLRVVGRTIIWANRAMEGLSGYPGGTLAGQSTRVLYASDERFETIGRGIFEALRAGKRFRAVEEMIREDGSRRWIEFTGMALSAVEPLESFWALDDVTDRCVAEQRLAQNEEQLRSMFAAMAEGVLLLDGEGRVLACNAAAERILGLAPGQAEPGAPFAPGLAFVGEDGGPFPADGLPARVTLRTGAPEGPVVIGLDRADGSRTWMSMSSTPIREGSDGPLRAVLSTFSDITALRLGEAQLREALQKVKTLTGLLPVCSSCKKIRDEAGHWNPMEAYISHRTEAGFTHGICPECAERFRAGQ